MSETATSRRIRAQASPRDPATMRFILDAPIQAGPSASFEGPDAYVPLARALFAIDGIRKVQVVGETILVTSANGHDWQPLKTQVAASIRQVLDSTDRPLGDAPDTASSNDDTALLAAVTDVLDTRANPSIAGHGGHISAESVENGIVHLRMSGGCQGCAASTLTLRKGVETMLRAALPAIREIVDVTDHSRGKNPFYRNEPGKSPALTRTVPAGSIAWQEGQMKIDPDYLAPRLGLKPDELQAGLSRGEVVVETETGSDSASGEMRVTVRSAQRVWAADVIPDGTAREVLPRRGLSATEHAPSLPDRVRSHLESLPVEDLPIAYGLLTRDLNMFAPGSIRRVTDALETTMREDFEADRSFIAARAVGRGSGALPGKGFFEFARALGRGPRPDETEAAFHRRHLTESFGAKGRFASGTSKRRDDQSAVACAVSMKPPR